MCSDASTAWVASSCAPSASCGRLRRSGCKIWLTTCAVWSCSNGRQSSLPEAKSQKDRLHQPKTGWGKSKNDPTSGPVRISNRYISRKSVLFEVAHNQVGVGASVTLFHCCSNRFFLSDKILTLLRSPSAHSITLGSITLKNRGGIAASKNIPG